MAISLKIDDLKINTSAEDNYGLGATFYIKPDGTQGSEKTDMCLSVSRITLHKKMYEPCYVDIELTFNNVDNFSNTNFIDGLKKYFTGTANRKLNLKNDATVIANNYYINGIKIKKVWREGIDNANTGNHLNRRQVFLVILRAYSPDYFLTLTKYSKVYTNQSFSSILSTEINTNRGFSNIFKVGNLCHTTYNNNELKQPYLVQYNESFHDFAVRVANRCGELFYYENGTLNYGIEAKNLSGENLSIKDLLVDPEEYSFECSAPDKSVPEVSLYRKNLTYDHYDTAAGDSEYLCDENTVSDEFFRTLDKEKDSFSMGEVCDAYWLGIFYDFLNGSDFISALSNGFKQAALVAINGSQMRTENSKDAKDEVMITSEEVTDFNALQNGVLDTLDENEIKTFKDNYKANHPEEFKDDKGNELTTDTDIDNRWKDKDKNPYKALEAKKVLMKMDERDLTNAFYDWIYKAEKRNTANIQIQKSDNVSTDMLGEFVRLSNTSDSNTYLVYGVDIDIYNLLELENNKYTNKTYVESSVTLSPTVPDNRRKMSKAYQSAVFPPLTGKPRILHAEPQQAVVCSISDPLRMGRVKIKYPWSNNQQSIWVPMLVPFASTNDSGISFMPNVSDYVMIDYEGGNIERPFIDGAMFHKDTKPSWGSIAQAKKPWSWRIPHRCISVTGNGMTLISGNPNLFVNNMLPSLLSLALKGMGLDLASFDKRNYVGGGITLSDYYGIYNISMSSATRTISIDSPLGSVKMNAFSGITISAPNGDVKIQGKNITLEAGNDIKLVSGTNIKKSGMVTDTVNSIAAMTGAMAGTSLKNVVMAKTDFDLSKAFDFSFVRSVVEIILRPVSGSCSIISGRNVIMQSGGGKAIIPSATLSEVAKASKTSVFPSSSQKADEETKRLNLQSSAAKITRLTQYKENIFTQVGGLYRNLEGAISTYNNALNSFVNDHINSLKSAWETRNKVYDKIKAEDFDVAQVNDADLFEDGVEDDVKQTIKQALTTIHNNHKAILNVLKNENGKIKFSGVNALRDREIANYGLDADWSEKDVDTYLEIEFSAQFGTCRIKDSLINIKRKIIKGLINDLQNDVLGKGYIGDGDWTKAKYKKDVSQLDITTDEGWADFKSYYHIGTDKPSSPLSSALKSAASSFMDGAGLGDLYSYNSDTDSSTFMGSIQKTFNICGSAGPRSAWDASQGKGAIILAGMNNKSLYLKSDSNNWESIESPFSNEMDTFFEI